MRQCVPFISKNRKHITDFQNLDFLRGWRFDFIVRFANVIDEVVVILELNLKSNSNKEAVTVYRICHTFSVLLLPSPAISKWPSSLLMSPPDDFDQVQTGSGMANA